MTNKDVNEGESLEQITKEAGDGTTANLIRSLDLSTEEGFESLRQTLLPWGSNDENYKLLWGQKILDTQGNRLFPYEANRFSTTESSLGNWPLSLTGYLEEMRNCDLERKCEIYGHGISKIPSKVLQAFGFEDIRDLAASEKPNLLLATLYTSGEWLKTSLNGSDIGSLLYSLVRLKEKGIDIEQHPNYCDVKRIIDTQEKTLTLWNRVFLKDLSNRIENSSYNPSLSTEVSFSQMIQDIKEIHKIESYPYGMKRDPNTPSHYFDEARYNIKENARTNTFSQKITEEAEMLIGKISQYQRVLEEYDFKTNYAKPQVQTLEGGKIK